MEADLSAMARAARAELASGALRGAPLEERLRAIPYRDRDDWLDAVLGIEGPPPDDEPLPRGSVPYVPCGVDHVLALARELPLRREDAFVDLGAGLGRVVLLAHLLSGARARGVEIQGRLVDAARGFARALSLSDVAFDHANALDCALDGSVFFLYAPFSGDTLRRVLDRLAAVAAERRIRVCAVDVPLEARWLAPRPTSSAALTIYESRE